MSKNIWIGAIVVVAVIAIGGAYFVGQNSHNQTPTANIPQAIVAQPVTESPTATPTAQTSPSTADKLITNSNNGLTCEKIANEAASNDQKRTGQSTTVLQTHYSQTLNQCYYEVSIVSNGTTSTDIRVAPDDNWIAECSTGVYPPPELFCTQHNIGKINEDQFKQLENTYFTN